MESKLNFCCNLKTVLGNVCFEKRFSRGTYSQHDDDDDDNDDDDDGGDGDGNCVIVYWFSII